MKAIQSFFVIEAFIPPTGTRQVGGYLVRVDPPPNLWSDDMKDAKRFLTYKDAEYFRQFKLPDYVKRTRVSEIHEFTLSEEDKIDAYDRAMGVI